ncbi:MAG: cyclic-di-AMP receptor [Monoglobales bacterium]
MKLIMAIVSSDDSSELISVLTKSGFSVTKLATTGGFLRSGNTTVIIGVEEDKVEDVFSIIKSTCSTRKQITTNQAPFGGVMPYPIEIEVGGAAVFVLDVDKFIKL